MKHIHVQWTRPCRFCLYIFIGVMNVLPSKLLYAEKTFDDILTENQQVIKVLRHQQTLLIQETLQFKKLFTNQQSLKYRDITTANRLAYYKFLKNFRFTDLYNLPESNIKSLVNKHKSNLYLREQIIIEYLNQKYESHTHHSKSPIDIEALSTIADIGWESAHLLTMTQTAQRANQLSPQQFSNSLSMASYLNLGASGIGLGLTLLNSINLISKSSSLSENKRELVLVQKMKESWTQQLIETKKNDPENPIALPLNLDIDDLEKEITVLSSQIKLQKKMQRKMFSQLLLESGLSGSYFTTSAMIISGSSSLSVGVMTHLLGGVTYGALLAWIGQKGWSHQRKAHELINKEVNLLKAQKKQLIGSCHHNEHYCKDRMMILSLKIRNLTHYQRTLSIWNMSKHASTIGLGLSSASSGLSGVCVAFGVSTVFGTTLAISGYGVAAFLAGALVSGSSSYIIKHHYPNRFHEKMKKKFSKHVRTSQLYATKYYKEKRNLEKAVKKYRQLKKRSKKLEIDIKETFKEGTTSLAAMNAYAQFEALSEQMISTTKKIDKLVTKMNFNMTFLRAGGKKYRLFAKKIFEHMSHLNHKQLNQFAYRIGMLTPQFQSIKSIQKKRIYLQTKICEIIIGLL